MASLSSELDIEAQANSDTGTQPAIIPPSPTNTENPQLPTSTAVPQPQATNANEHHNEDTPAQQTAADDSQALRGMLTSRFHQLQSHSCARREPRRLF